MYIVVMEEKNNDIDNKENISLIKKQVYYCTIYYVVQSHCTN